MRDSKKKTEIHADALRNFDYIQSTLYQERRQSLEDRRFYSIAGGQWEGSQDTQSEVGNHPKLEVNKIHLAVMKIINEKRNNPVTAYFISKDGTEINSPLADVCNGLFRADEQDSIAEEAYDNGFEEAVGGGLGAIRLTTEYEDEEDDENEKQRIRIEPIYDADSSVYFDLDAKRQDKADAKYCFVVHSMTHDAYKEEFDQSPSSVDKSVHFIEYDWYTPDIVYVAEYYIVEYKKETIRIFENLTGDEIRYSEEDFEEDEELEAELEATGSREVRQKKVKKRRIHKYLMDGNEILEDCGLIAGKNIPIAPVYGKRWFVDSVERCMGHVRLAKDTQRIKNMLMSKLAEISSLSPVEKPILMPEQVSQHEVMWAEDNIKNYPYLLLNPITDGAGNTQPSGPIAYTKPPSIPPALAALMQLVDVDMQELLGRSNDPDKMLSHVSGKAHEMIQKRIDGQAYIYMSNFAKAVQRVGTIWLSMAKEVYVDKGRNMKTVDTMGKVGSVQLMQPGIEDGKPVAKNDLSEASFDVAVEVGPSSDSQREATVSALTNILSITQDPEAAQVIQSMIMMNMEGEGLTESKEFFRKKLVQIGAVKPTEEEAQAMAEAAANAKPDPNEVALMAMAENEKAKAAKTRTEVLETLSDVELNKAKTAEIYSDIDINKAKTVDEIVNRTPNAG